MPRWLCTSILEFETRLTFGCKTWSGRTATQGELEFENLSKHRGLLRSALVPWQCATADFNSREGVMTTEFVACNTHGNRRASPDSLLIVRRDLLPDYRQGFLP